jgi:FkbM family methyltransferase
VFRRLIELLARGRIVWRTLPNGVRIAVSPDAQLKYLKPRFDEDLVRVADEHVEAGSVVWDIGTNCGTFAFSCKQASERMAVEPDPFLANLLRQSSEASGVPVKVVQAAVGSTAGKAVLTIARRGRATNHLASVEGSTQTGGERGRIMVDVVSLDSLLTHSTPDFVKIDIEGAEVLALEGASDLLSRVRPKMYLEVAPGNEGRCRELLKGYTIEEDGPNWLVRP